VWPLLQQDDRDRIFSRCLDEETGKPFARSPGRLLARATVLAQQHLLSDRQASQLARALQRADLWVLLGTEVPVELLVKLLIPRLRAWGFEDSNKAASVLRSLGKGAIGGVPDELQGELGSALAAAANGNAFVALDLLDEIVAAPDTWPEEFKRSMVIRTLIRHGRALPHDQASKSGAELALSDSSRELARAALREFLATNPAPEANPSHVDLVREVLRRAGDTPAKQALDELLAHFSKDDTETVQWH
jgi:hypothetical protein